MRGLVQHRDRMRDSQAMLLGQPTGQPNGPSVPPAEVINIPRVHVHLLEGRANSGASMAVVTLQDAQWASIALEVAFEWKFDVPTDIDPRGWRRASVRWWR